jgi:hypothetical protein
MAGRLFNQFRFSFEKKPVDIYMAWDGGGAGVNCALLNPLTSVTKAGANTAVAAPTGGIRGVTSVTRVGDGEYTIKFQDNYAKLLDVSFVVYAKDNSAAPLANGLWVKSLDLGAAGGATVTVRTYLATIGTGVSPGTNDRWFINFTFGDSSTP